MLKCEGRRRRAVVWLGGGMRRESMRWIMPFLAWIVTVCGVRTVRKLR